MNELQLSFNPTDVHSLATVYNGVLRFYRLTPDGNTQIIDNEPLKSITINE